MGMDPRTVDVSVAGGVVLLRGGVDRRSEVAIVEHLVAGLDGVVSVQNELRYAFDDSHVGARAEARVH
jgi:osmotically-inducible protein OsmY